MLTLPKNSKYIRVLNAEESARLDEKFPFTPKRLKDCPTCRGELTFKWWVEYNVPSEEIGEYECPCAEQFVLHKYLLNAGIGLDYQRYNLGDLDDVSPLAVEASADYLTNSDYYLNRGIGFTFQGDRGTGKTLLSALLLKQLLDTGVDGYFTTFDEMIDNFASGWRDERLKRWFEARVRNAPLLVVDDIGKEHAGRIGIAQSMIDNIFRSRVSNAQPTIITTNLEPHEMATRYSSALETIAGRSMNFQFNGTSYRKSDKERNRFKFELENKLSRPIVIA